MFKTPHVAPSSPFRSTPHDPFIISLLDLFRAADALRLFDVVASKAWAAPLLPPRPALVVAALETFETTPPFGIAGLTARFLGRLAEARRAKYSRPEGRQSPTRLYLDSQVAGNHRPLYPKVDHYWVKVAHNYEPLALQVVARVS